VSVVQRTLSLRKVGSREEVRRARVYAGDAGAARHAGARQL